MTGPNRGDRPRRVVFYSVAAQWDNLGDIEIRRTGLEWIRASGSRVIAFTGTMPDAYLDAFDKGDGVLWISSPVKYQAALWRHILRRRASIVFAPGPQVFGPGRRSMLKSFVNLVNVSGVRMSGGAVLAVGRSLRGNGRLARSLERLVVSRFHMYVVRDSRSASVLGSELASAPDLAFEHAGAVHAGPRDVAVLSLRGDRPVDVPGLKSVVRELERRGMKPLLVTQVKRDDKGHSALADELRVPSLLWGENTHAEQLALVRDAYSSAAIVISNRLHALIFGMEHGAAPVAVLDVGSDKLRSTLEQWVPLGLIPPNFDSVDGQDWSELASQPPASALNRAVEDARAALVDIRREFVEYLSVR